ncbi:hypothetical protein FBEOM_5429 [Fusarium beomiforme]|uniref:Uncharacterized protein n=1 Tax=Fusarium beomiforme TaxID=44412 RepID=A0A9P5DZ15_9HYPO|nr:hypothetical protein FBEOM_5429 [Fusarium beomiforme]
MDAVTASSNDFTMDALTAPMGQNGLTADEKEALDTLESAYIEGFENGGDPDFRLASWIKGFKFARALFAPKPPLTSIASASQSVHPDLPDDSSKQEVYQGGDSEDGLVEATVGSSGNQLLPSSHPDASSQTVHPTLPGDKSEQEAPFIEDIEDTQPSDIEPIAPTAGKSLVSDGQAQSPGSPSSATDYPDSKNSSDKGNSTRPTTPSVTADSPPDITTTPMGSSTQQPIFIDLTVEDGSHDGDCQISQPEGQRRTKRKQSHEGKRRTPKRPRLERELKDDEFALRVVSVYISEKGSYEDDHEWTPEEFAHDTERIDAIHTIEFLVNSGNWENLEFQKTQVDNSQGTMWKAQDAFGVYEVVLSKEDIKDLMGESRIFKKYKYIKIDN